MAFASVGTLGTAASKAASTSTYALTTSAQLDSGNLGILIVAGDNINTTDGNFNEHRSVVDSGGNSWTKACEWTNGQGAGAGGATVSIWYRVATANLASSSTVTVTFSSAITAKALTAWEFTWTTTNLGVGVFLTTTAQCFLVNDGADAGAMTISGLASREYLWVRGGAVEDATTTYTPSTNYTQFTNAHTSGGGGASNMAARGEFRVLTATTDSTNPTTSAADQVSAYVAFYEMLAPEMASLMPVENRVDFPARRAPFLHPRAMPFYVKPVGITGSMTSPIYGYARTESCDKVSNRIISAGGASTTADYIATPSVGALRTLPPPSTHTGSFELDTVATTSQQKGLIAKLVSDPILAPGGTINQTTWEVSFTASQGNTLANLRPSGVVLYVYRPSTEQVVGYLYDNTNNSKVPIYTTTDYTSTKNSFDGASLAVAAGDVLILELWAVHTQGAATSYDVSVATGSYSVFSTPAVQVGTDTVITGCGAPALAALSSNRVAFIDSTNDALRVYDFNGTSWTRVGTDTVITGCGWPALAALSSNRVAFIDEFNEDLRVYDFNGTSWAQVGTDTVITGCAAPALAALSSNRVAFIDYTNQDLRVYDFNGTSWTQVGTDTVIAGCSFPALAALSSTRVAFIDAVNEDLRVYDFNGTSWTQVGTDTVITGCGVPALAALSSTRVVFIDAVNADLRTYKFESSGFTTINLSALDPGTALQFADKTVDAIFPMHPMICEEVTVIRSGQDTSGEKTS